MESIHEITEDRGGENELGWIKPKCSCGWVGQTHHAYEDYQHHEVERDVVRHLNEAKKNATA